ncbi:MAG: recombinase family protein [Clostridiales bacterium]|nr:recombinase family protein [Clostridiales bacterium]
MLKVAAYCRVSTDREDQKNSFEGQKSYFESYINSKSDWELVNIYADEGISGTSTKKRKQFNDMIYAARAGKIDMIITKEVSRFARNTIDTLQYTRDLKQIGVGVYFINDNINTLDSDGELRLTIMASIAQEESRKTSERVKWGQKRRMEQGVVFGHNILGYHLQNGVLTVNEEEAKLVRHIYNKYLDGKGLHIIAKELQEEGYKTKTGNSEWTNKVIRTILQNEKYVGDLLQKKTITPNFLTHEKKYNRGEEEMVYIRNHHEPIIDREIFDFVQAEFKRKSEVYKNDNSKHSNRYAFSGKIKCGCCGRRYVARFRKRKDGSKRKIWSCYNGIKNGIKHEVNGEIIGCNNKAIGNDVLESAVLQALNEISYNKQAVISKVTKVVNEVIDRQTENRYDFKKAEQMVEKLESKKLKNIDMYYDNMINEADFKKMMDMYQEDINRLKAEISEERKKTEVLNNKDELLNEICNTITQLVNFEVFDDSVVKEVVDKIVIISKFNIEVYIKGCAGHGFFFTDNEPITESKWLPIIHNRYSVIDVLNTSRMGQYNKDMYSNMEVTVFISI